MAGRIPQSFIDDVVERVDIVDLIGQQVKLKRTGKNYSGLCPFHNEKTPSFSVNPQKQFYYCFGCGAGGNSLKFLLEHDRLPFPEAIETLARMAGLEVPREDNPAADRRRQQARAQQDIMAAASDYYRAQLRTHAQGENAVGYLKKRGLSGSLAQRFALGYAPPGWDNLLRQLGSGDSRKQAQLVENGLVIAREDGRVYDRFRDRIMFPIRDVRGRTIGFGGRIMGEGKPKYLNSPETPLFQKGRELYGLYEALQQKQTLTRLVVVEGYMDVIALHQFGLPYAVATLGTATSSEHLTKMFRWVSEVVFCFDGDQAGRQAALRALNNALPEAVDGRTLRFLFLPENEDPDTLVRQDGPEGFNQRLDQAPTLSEFLLQHWRDQVDMDTLDGRARLVHIALPQLLELPAQGLLRQLLAQRLAEEAGLATASIQQQLEAAHAHARQKGASRHVNPATRPPTPVPQTRPDQGSGPGVPDLPGPSDPPDQTVPEPPAWLTETDWPGPETAPALAYRAPVAADLVQSRQPPPWQQAMALLLCWPTLAARIDLTQRAFNPGDHNDWVQRMLHLLQEKPASNRYEALDQLAEQGLGDILRALSRTEYFAILTRFGAPQPEHEHILKRLIRRLTHQPSAQDEYQSLRQQWLEARHSMSDEQKQRYLALLKSGRGNPL